MAAASGATTPAGATTAAPASTAGARPRARGGGESAGGGGGGGGGGGAGLTVRDAGGRPGGMGNFFGLLHKHRGLIAPLGFIMLLVVVLVPLPAWVMDILICLNIALSVIILLTTIYMKEPLEFSVFPSLLLATTLFRLVLNVASTRLVLTADAATPEAAIGVAGHVIEAFAQFVAGSSLFVGVVIFIILVIVQFVVITKGATRVSEVAARFTLDAMPGKQMAIDADLNAGVIDEKEARRRRERIAHEADFFGAMDGASKFVRGDAIAGLIITVVNVMGGFAVGIIDRGWPAAQTAAVFTKLTIGDGLTSQIPSFVIAIASALIVTRSGSKEDLGRELTGQLVSQPVGLYVTSGFLGLLALTPLPTIPLVATALLLSGIAYSMQRTARTAKLAEEKKSAASAGKVPEGPTPESLLKLDTLELEVGYGLVGLVDAGQGGDLLERIAAIRRQLAAELGFVLPPVRIRDNMQLSPNEYRIKIKGAVVAKGETVPGKLLAMDSGIATGRIEGEPAFGLDAWWVDPSLKTKAETMNFTVVDATSVLATHLTEVVKLHAGELLTREEVHNLVTQLKEKSPKLVEEVVPAVVKMGDLQKVLQNLLRERVPIRDLDTILETLADWGGKTKDMDVLTEYVRNGLKRTICQIYATPITERRANEPGAAAFRIACVTLDPALEDLINSFVDRSGGATVVNMPARIASAVSQHILQSLQQLSQAGHQPVVLASPQVRGVVRQLLEPYAPTAAVLGYNEAVSGVEIESVALVGVPPGLAGAPTTAAA
ncbi:MAG TPA: flagellar biosynthesis protein FlhA [Phycisphaerales bacterium]|nr:flagellar biosynthesis protein FlhA [Phycisphaerales bacterium]